MTSGSPITKTERSARTLATLATLDAPGYGGVNIHCQGEMVSLTDMWRAAGSNAQQAPAKWRALPTAKAFVEHVALTVGKSDSDLFATKIGGWERGTWAHWHIAMAYAKYLSPEFHMWCNTVVRSHMERLNAGSTELPVAGPIDVYMPTVLGFVDRAVDVHLNTFREVVLPGLVANEVSKLAPQAIEGITAGEVIGMAGFEDQAGLKGLARIVSDRLRRFHAQRGVAIREKTLGRTRAYIFDRVTCREWLAAGGKATIMQCVAERRGQGRLRLA